MPPCNRWSHSLHSCLSTLGTHALTNREPGHMGHQQSLKVHHLQKTVTMWWTLAQQNYELYELNRCFTHKHHVLNNGWNRVFCRTLWCQSEPLHTHLKQLLSFINNVWHACKLGFSCVLMQRDEKQHLFFPKRRQAVILYWFICVLEWQN